MRGSRRPAGRLWTGASFIVRGSCGNIAPVAAAIVLLSACGTVDRARVDAALSPHLLRAVDGGRALVIASVSARAETDRSTGELGYEVTEIAGLALELAAGKSAALEYVPDASAGMHLEIDIRERSYTRGVERVQALAAVARVHRITAPAAARRPIATAVYRGDSGESIVSSYFAAAVMSELLGELSAAVAEALAEATEAQP